MKKNFTLNFKYQTATLFLALLLCLNGSFSLHAQTSDEALASQNGAENLAKRSQFSKHFLNNDGSTTAIVTAGNSLNFKDLDGNWQTIDNSIVTSNSPKYPEHSWENTNNRFQSYYPNDVADGIITTYTEGTVKEGLKKKMIYMDADFNTISEFNMNTSIAEVTNRTVSYKDVFSGIDLSYTQLNDGRKMDYIIGHSNFTENLSDDVHYLAFAEDVELPNGAFMVSEKNASGISNINVIMNGELVFRYDLPKHYDSNGQEVFSNYLVRGNTIYTLVEKSWLTSNLSYPVFIDPTVTVYPTGNGDYLTGTIDSEGTGNKTAPADIYVGMRHAYGLNTGTRRFFRAWASFDVSTIPVGSTMDNVIFGCYIGLNSLYEVEGQFIRVAPITSGVPNQQSGGTLYNMCGENATEGLFSVNPGTDLVDATIDITTVVPSYLESSLASGTFSLGFAPVGDYDPGYTEQVGIYGSTRPQQTAQGKPYLTITYTEPELSVDNYNLNTVGFYPNPVVSDLNISTVQDVSSVEVYSLLGQLLLSETNTSQLNVSNLNTGMYLVKVQLDNGQTVSQKFMKK